MLLKKRYEAFHQLKEADEMLHENYERKKPEPAEPAAKAAPKQRGGFIRRKADEDTSRITEAMLSIGKMFAKFFIFDLSCPWP